MKKFFYFGFIFLISTGVWAKQKNKSKNKVVYKYEKKDEISFNDLLLKAKKPLEVTLRSKNFKLSKNAIPLRKDFKDKIIIAVESIR